MQSNNLFTGGDATTKLLVVDDDPNFLFGVSRILAKASFSVVTAADGENAIRKAQTEQPDLILLDVNMPKMDGFAVKKILEQSVETQNIPVVFLTALNDRTITLHGLNHADCYINKPIDPDILVARINVVLRRLSTGYSQAIRDSKNPIFSIDQYQQWGQAVEVHDYGTAGHTQRVAHWFVALARLIGLTGKDLDNARAGAVLHDIGKLAVPPDVLNKPAPLTEKEWQIIRQHPQLGYEMLATVEPLRQSLDIPHYHHERWDGLGYPDHLSGEAIPLPVRIFSVVDVFDALLSRRPYKVGLNEQEAKDILLSQRGKQFDPAIVDFFIENYNAIKREAEGENDPDNIGH